MCGIRIRRHGWRRTVWQRCRIRRCRGRWEYDGNHGRAASDAVDGRALRWYPEWRPVQEQQVRVRVPGKRRGPRQPQPQRSDVAVGRDGLRGPGRARCRALSRSRPAIQERVQLPRWRSQELVRRCDADGWECEALRQIRNGPLLGGEDAGWFLRNRNGWLAYVD
jgi:hypothetical protein